MGHQVRDPERAAGAPTRLVRGHTALGVTEERTERGQCPRGERARPQLKGRLPGRAQAHDFLEHGGREVDPTGENEMPGDQTQLLMEGRF